MPDYLNDEVRIPHTGSNADVAGRTGFESLGLHALEALARRSGMRGLDEGRPVPVVMAEQLAGEDPQVRSLVRDIATNYGSRIAHLVHSMRSPFLVIPGLTPQIQAYFKQWQQVTKVHLGGGIVASELGALMAGAANRTAAGIGLDGVMFGVSPNPSLMPTVGCARSVPTSEKQALAIDFGQGSVKRSIATIGVDGVQRIDQWRSIGVGNLSDQSSPREVAGFVAACIAQTFGEVRTVSPVKHAAVSIAAHMVDGVIVPQDGTYGRAAGISSADVSAAVSERVGAPVIVDLIPDGDAATRAMPGTARDAVLVLGTALAGGFVPSQEGLAPLSPSLKVFRHGDLVPVVSGTLPPPALPGLLAHS